MAGQVVGLTYITRVRVQLRGPLPGRNLPHVSNGIMNIIYGCIREVTWPFEVRGYERSPLAVKRVTKAAPMAGKPVTLLRFVAIVKIPARTERQYHLLRHACLIALGPFLKKYHPPQLRWVREGARRYKGTFLPTG